MRVVIPTFSFVGPVKSCHFWQNLLDKSIRKGVNAGVHSSHTCCVGITLNQPQQCPDRRRTHPRYECCIMITNKPFSKAELEAKLNDQLSFIESSIAAFDSGNEAESLRMAIAVRVLFHHTARSDALLQQLGELEDLELPNTANPLPSSYHSRREDGTGGVFGKAIGLRLCYWSIPVPGSGGSLEFRPKVDQVAGASMCAFSEWWEGTTVLQPAGETFLDPPREELMLKRKAVVLGLSNKEGGAHVDPNPSFEWWYSTRAGVYGRETKDANGNFVWSLPLSASAIRENPDDPIITPVHATMRTIAEEVLFALRVSRG